MQNNIKYTELQSIGIMEWWNETNLAEKHTDRNKLIRDI